MVQAQTGLLRHPLDRTGMLELRLLVLARGFSRLLCQLGARSIG